MRELFRSTPFRITVILGTAFFFAVLLAGLIAYSLIENELAQRMDQTITDTFKVIGQDFGDSDQADLVETVQSHAAATLSHDKVYGLADTSGKLLAGNVTVMPAGEGWLSVGSNMLGVTGDDARYRLFVGTIGSNRLLVGQSFVENTEIARLTLTSIAWASVAILLLVIATGTIVAVRAQRRIDGIGVTMAAVGQGELKARIPVSGRSDDIDRLASQVNAALDRLEALVAGMREVSINIAHDLKTPLNRLAIMLEAAEREADGGSVGSALTQAQVELQRISATFDALLRIAQIETGARRARFVPTDLGAVLDRIANAYVDVAEERGQSLAVQKPVEVPRIDGDAELLTQLCANLVENAMRHTRSGTHIRLGAASAGDRLLLTCADNGPGIVEEERSKVFQRLYRIDKSRSTPGSGLGLSLVKAIADLHGAEVTLGDNAPGLVVTLSFPTTAPARLGPGRRIA
jgi:signal transduction histidine kinase